MEKQKQLNEVIIGIRDLSDRVEKLFSKEEQQMNVADSLEQVSVWASALATKTRVLYEIQRREDLLNEIKKENQEIS